MKMINEFRVRPATRYNLTHYHSDDKGSACRSLGEFDTIAQAEEIGILLSSIIPGATFKAEEGREPVLYPLVQILNDAMKRDEPKQYVIVKRGFEPETKAYYAYSPDEADKRKASLEAEQGGEYRIYVRQDG